MLQSDLVKTRAQLSWAMKQLFKKEEDKSTEAVEEKSAEAVDNKEEGTDAEAPEGGIELDEQQEAEE